MAKRIPNQEQPKNIVNSGTREIVESSLLFVFDRFKASSINIQGEFNSFYKDPEEYIRKISIFLGKALPLLSRENSSLFKDGAKLSQLHLHKVLNKRAEVERVLKEYGFPEDDINSIFDGANIYQFEVPYENGAFRVVFELIGDNVISFLFLDPNHHIYFNKDKVKESGSLFYEYCPVYGEKQCERMDYFDTCFAFEYLDFEKYKASFSNKYCPD